MEDRHFSGDELLDELYGISARLRPRLHLDTCDECRGRWNAICKTRSLELARPQPEVPEAFLLHQRVKLMNTIERRAVRPKLPGLVPAMALAIVCAIAILLTRPAPVPEPYRISDAQFFTEAYNVAESSEPRSAAPIRNLFQGEQQH